MFLNNVKKESVTSIILAAGNSTRFGKNMNKNFEKVSGKHVLSYSIEAFNNNDYVDSIVIAAREFEIDKVSKIIENENLKKPYKILIGGSNRKESVYNCLKEIDSDIVIIHDGARPMIKQKYINSCIENMENYQGVTIGVKSKDTIKIVNENGIVINTTKRENTWLVQTPQCFRKDILLNMHRKYSEEDVTDDCELLEKDGYKVKLIEGDYSNIKITTQEDLKIIENLLK